MPTPDRCLARAEEAERLAAMVSYARDRERLIRQAAEWRARAAELQAAGGPTHTQADAGTSPSPLGRLLQRLRRAAG